MILFVYHKYGGQNEMSVNINPKTYPMHSKNDDIL